MCQTGISGEAVVVRVVEQETQIKTRLNPGALEFRSDSSTSESSSPVRKGGVETPVSVVMEPPTIVKSRKSPSGDYIVSSETIASMPRSSSGNYRQDRGGAQFAPRRPSWGWESPQAVMSSSPAPPPIEQLMIPPTRQLSIKVGQDEEDGPLLGQLSRFGELRHCDTSQRASHGLVVASFFDIRGAIAAHDALSPSALLPHANPAAPPLPPRSVRFVSLGAANSSLRAGSPAAEAAGFVEILAVEVTEGELSREALGRACAAHGEVCGVWGSGSLFFVEWMDSRCAERALQALPAEELAGCKLAVRQADLDPIVLLGRTSCVAQVAARMRGAMPGPPARVDSFGGRASPPPMLPGGSPPPVVMPVMPAYSWGAAYPVFHCYPPEVGPLDRAASPPAVFPNGSSPPLPSGFISIPIRAGSGTLYGSSPPYGSSPVYGTSPPGMGGGSPPAMVFMAPQAPMFDANGNAMMMAAPGGVSHYMAGADLMQRMAGLSMGPQQQQGQQQGQQQQDKQQRSDSRASARIARSHRAGGAYDPSEFEFSMEEAESARPDARATVMIRNIPNKYTQSVMLEVLEKSGFKGHFDFFYLPIDFRNKCNLGYAFLNFTSPEAAARLYKMYHNKRWEEYNSKKVCEISYARVQGRDPLIEHFRASKFPSEDIEYMPLVYTQGEDGLAGSPVSIHQYLASLTTFGSSASAAAEAAEAASKGAGELDTAPPTQ